MYAGDWATIIVFLYPTEFQQPILGSRLSIAAEGTAEVARFIHAYTGNRTALSRDKHDQDIDRRLELQKWQRLLMQMHPSAKPRPDRPTVHRQYDEGEVHPLSRAATRRADR